MYSFDTTNHKHISLVKYHFDTYQWRAFSVNHATQGCATLFETDDLEWAKSELICRFSDYAHVIREWGHDASQVPYTF